MQIFLGLTIDAGSILLSPDESKHCTKVLRHKRGDKINVIDGKGNFYEAELFDINPEACKAKILSTKQIGLKKDYSLHIAISPTKNPDRIEWMVEKCTEMGVDEFSFIVCKKSLDNAMKKMTWVTALFVSITDSSVRLREGLWRWVYNLIAKRDPAGHFLDGRIIREFFLTGRGIGLRRRASHLLLMISDLILALIIDRLDGAAE